MNLYQETLLGLSDDELKEAVREFKVFDEKGTLPTGALRRIFDTLLQGGRQDEGTVIGVSRFALYSMAAHKWAGV